MAEKIARNPGELYNPLHIYGPQNSGKTHILHAIGDLSTSEDPGLICELHSLASLIDAMQANPAKVEEWLKDLRLLILDDFEISSVTPDLQLQLFNFLKALFNTC